MQDLIQAGLLWIANLGAAGPIAFILLYILATVFFLPGSLLTLGAGALFGLVAGAIYTFVGAVLGSTIAFLIGRYLTRRWVTRQLERRPEFGAIAQAVADKGLQIVLLTRLSPVFPYNLLNYAYGITQVSLRDYVLGSVGMIPATVLYVYLGALVGNLAKLHQATAALSRKAQIGQGLLWGVGLVATVGVTIYVTRLARQALSRHVAPPISPGETTHVNEGEP